MNFFDPMLLHDFLAKGGQSVIVVNDEGKILSLNNAFEVLSSYHKLELLNKKLTQIISEKDWEIIHSLIDHVQVAELEFKLATKNGQSLYLHANLCFERINNEVNILMFLSNAQHKYHLEQQLTETKKRLSDFAYMTSHQLRLPIANIVGLINLLEDTELSQNERNEIQHNLQISANQLNDSVHSLNEIIHSIRFKNERNVFYQPGQKPKLIMLVDDDEVNNFVNKKLIKKFDPEIEVIDILSGQQAISDLEKGWPIPDILFLDLSMPVFDGWMFLDKAKNAQLQHCRFFILTTSLDPADRIKANTYPFVIEFISKPLSLEKLESLIYMKPLDQAAAE